MCSISEKERAIEAFKLMTKHKISAVAVTSEDKKFKDVITVKDLRVPRNIVLIFL